MDEPEDARPILDLIDEPHRSALRAWMEFTNTELRPVSWSGRGNTKASLLAAYAARRGAKPIKVIVKLHPPGTGIPPEPGRHADALVASPPAFRDKHLVKQPFDPIPVDGDGYILFQEIAGGRFRGLEPLSRPLEEGLAAFGDVAPVCADVMALVLGGWNPGGPRLAERTVPAFLTSVLGDRVAPGGKIREWVRDPAHHARPRPGGGPVVPDPLVLLDGDGPAADVLLQVLTGNAHGDLHPGNVIVSADRKARPPVRRLIDLSRFGTDAPLSHDPLHFVMAMIAPCLPGLPEPQRVALGEFLVDPARGHRALVPNGLSEVITRTSLATSAWALSTGMADEWEDLHLPSVVACALLYAGRAFFPREDRLWFTWVAARAAADFLTAHDLPVPVAPGAGSAAPGDGARSVAPPATSGPAASAVPGTASPGESVAAAFHSRDQYGEAFYQGHTIHVHLPGHPGAAVPDEPGAAWPDPRAPGSGVPQRVPYFVGRERELAELHALMRAGRPPVVAVHGIPGTGKTQFALEYAHRFSAEYPRMWWISAAQPELLGEQFGGMARALGLNVQGDVRSVRGMLFDALRAHGRWLLVFDDAPDAEAIQAYVPASDAADVLITSRNPEWSALAAPFPLGPLEPEESRSLLTALLDDPLTGRPASDGERDGSTAPRDSSTAARDSPSNAQDSSMAARDSPPSARDSPPSARGSSMAVRTGSPGARDGSTARRAGSEAMPPGSEAVPDGPGAGRPVSPAEQAVPIAETLGHLPLAVAQAALFLRDAPLDPEDYAEELASRTADALDTDPVPGYGRTLADVWSLSLGSLAEVRPEAVDLLRACAFLADAPVPLDLLAAGAAGLPGDLPAVAGDRLRLTAAAKAAARLGLLRIEGTALRVHGLLQAFLRDTAPGPVPDLRPALARAHPGDPRDPCSWPGHGRLLPHALALDLPGSAEPACHRLYLDALHYLAVRGDTRTVLDLTTAVYVRWLRVLGPDAAPVLDAMSLLSRAHHDLGAHRRALELDEEVHDRRGRLLGPDDPATLAAGHNVAGGLSALARGGDLPPEVSARAVTLLETVVDARRRVLGATHPETLRSVHNLATELHTQGLRGRARELCEAALAGLTAALEADHPDILRSAHLLALLLADEEPERARRLNEDTLRRRTRVLGPGHPDTLGSAHSHARDLWTAGFPLLAAERARDTWLRLCATSGEDHPEALRAADLLTRVLRDLGDRDGARRLSEDTYHRRARLLGADHIDTLRSADQYATDLRAAGETTRAAELARRTADALTRLMARRARGDRPGG
ncbi:tetratricopeptide repeat protein [Sphaerisporangium sp. B11E5]|uniref:tetratricopeptide repeat protein n=1 Tax=Sphaerisporangium sp. B11E5 TaxID=3153563 RepID=UPI00325D8DBA